MARFLLVCVFVSLSHYIVTEKKELQNTISDMNEDDYDTMDYEEFLKMMDHKILNRDLKDEISTSFRLFDDDVTDKKVQETDGPMGPGGRYQVISE